MSKAKSLTGTSFRTCSMSWGEARFMRRARNSEEGRPARSVAMISPSMTAEAAFTNWARRSSSGYWALWSRPVAETSRVAPGLKYASVRSPSSLGSKRHPGSSKGP
jgi:hypothetical protein